MKLSKCARHATEMVLHSRLRSWLTILGIVIGVAAVIAIVSIGDGMQATIEDQMSGLGGDILTLSAGSSRGHGMFEDDGPSRGGGGSAASSDVILDASDLQILKGIPDIAYIDTQIRGSVKIAYLGSSGTASLTGVDQKTWAKVTTATIAEGRMLDSADQNVIVIGGRLAKSYFSQPIGINKMLAIEGGSFRVVGILDDESNGIYMPLQQAYQVIPDKETGVYDTIVIKVKDESALDGTIAKIESRLMTARHVTTRTKDFTLSSSKAMQQTRTQMMASINAFLLAIAAVSLIVGAVGVANTMFTSVMEKTKEIGIMKAIGARNKDILTIFLLNAALIGLIGGVLGVLLGMILSGALPSLMGTSMPMGRGGLMTLVSLRSVIMAMIISVVVGVIAGVVPAYQASKLKPVDALRFE